MRLIDAEALKEHKFPQVKIIGGRRCGKTRDQITEAYQKGWNDCIDVIINNVPTVPQGEWVKKEDVIDLLKKWADGYYYLEIPIDDAIKGIENIIGGAE